MSPFLTRSQPRRWKVFEQRDRAPKGRDARDQFRPVLLFTSTALAGQVAQSDIEVVDGRTIRVHGEVIHIMASILRNSGRKRIAGSNGCWRRERCRGFAKSSAAESGSR